MAPDRTRTLTVAREGESAAGRGARRGALVVAWHRDRALVGMRWLLADGVSHEVGRGPEGPLPGVFEDARISRRHLRLCRRASGALEAEDLQSRNGTFVDGERLSGRRVLQPGQVLRLGNVVLVYVDPAGPVPSRRDPYLVGRSSALGRVLDQVDLAGPRDSTVLVVGETGTGKELVARALHAASGRSGELVPVNCGALGEGTFMSELFGHVKGAFTGAARSQGGLVGAAAGGTLFLDEVGDAPPAVQVALLRFLQEGEVRAVGASAARRVDVRVVAATHRDLAHGPAPSGFRHDLLERLRRWVIEVPPLRDRREDIPLLVEHLARRHCGPGPGPRPSPDLAERLCLAPWPGNVRQLDAVVEYLVAWGQGELRDDAPGLEARLGGMGLETPSSVSLGATRPRRTTRPEADELRELLAAADGNVRQVSRELGVARRTVYRWMAALGIDPSEAR